MNLTKEQLQELEKGEPIRVTIGETPCVILREDIYEEEVDASPWTLEEMDLLADEADEIISRSETPMCPGHHAAVNSSESNSGLATDSKIRSGWNA